MSAVPDRIAVAAHGRLLRLSMSDGSTLEIDAPRLRGACNCAACRRARLDGHGPSPDPNVTIQQAEAIGQYAVSIGFSDGHARGIYPWSYLAALATEDLPPGPAQGHGS